MTKGDYAAVVDAYTKALAMSPFVAAHYYARGLAFYRQGKCNEALADFDRALLLDARTTPAYVYRGLCRSGRGEYQQALADYSAALAANPQDPAIHNDLAWHYTTADDEKFRDKAKALEHAKKAAELSKETNAEILDTLAKAHFVDGDVKEAVEAEARAVRLSPSNSGVPRAAHPAVVTGSHTDGGEGR